VAAAGRFKRRKSPRVKRLVRKAALLMAKTSVAIAGNFRRRKGRWRGPNLGVGKPAGRFRRSSLPTPSFEALKIKNDN
jgi:hypothetical protein